MIAFRRRLLLVPSAPPLGWHPSSPPSFYFSKLLPSPPPASHAPIKILIMPPRTLGGGRVLGNANAFTSAAASSSPQQQQQQQPKGAARILSPSASSVSLGSQASASQFSSAESQDLISRISLENGDTSISAAPAAAGAQLACPICSEEMVCFPFLHIESRLFMKCVC